MGIKLANYVGMCFYFPPAVLALLENRQRRQADGLNRFLCSCRWKSEKLILKYTASAKACVLLALLQRLHVKM